MTDAVSRAFASAARHYDDHAALQVQAGRWLCQQWRGGYADTLLDVGCGTGLMGRELRARGLARQVLGVDCAEAMLRASPEPLKVRADMAALPLAAHSVDGVVANLSLQWAAQPLAVLQELLRVTRPGASICFTVPAPGSLHELAASWRAAGDAHRHVNTFYSARQWDDFSQAALARSSLRGEVHLQQREFVRWFASPRAALQSLRGVGANRVTAGARPGLTGKQQFANMLQQWERLRQREGIPLSYQLLCVQIDVLDSR